MKKALWFSVMSLGAFILLLTGCRNSSKTAIAENTELSVTQLIEKGNYFVTIMGCNDCHSPKELGPQGPEVVPDLMLSGYPALRPFKKVDPELIKKGWILFDADLTAAAGPWGVSFAANLTSDQTGIGNWTEENFRRALKEGRYKGLEASRMLLPPMPWTNFTGISNDDIKAIFQYLKSTKPVSNVVPLSISPVQNQ
ncbi:MAG TPA: diheme cytochrome c-553 [Bacteroidales bacterium]|nr:diheme cytochrome c-553 [Bacteroidales bacterium]HBZ21376.1 diheme cytochrome c-553 [Bacteroidales bacterium]